MRRAGLLVIDCSKKILVVMKRKIPYDEKNPNVEMYYIPRGILNRGEAPLYTAVREFVEETRYFPSKYTFTGKSFKLFWHDPIDVLWEYKIHLVYANLSYEDYRKTCLRKRRREENIIVEWEDGKFDSSTCKITRWENDEFRLMHVNEYIRLLDIQLKSYNGPHSYIEFIRFIRESLM